MSESRHWYLRLQCQDQFHPLCSPPSSEPQNHKIPQRLLWGKIKINCTFIYKLKSYLKTLTHVYFFIWITNVTCTYMYCTWCTNLVLLYFRPTFKTPPLDPLKKPFQKIRINIYQQTLASFVTFRIIYEIKSSNKIILL